MIVVAHLSDLHFGANVAGATGSIAGEVAAFRPDLTVVSGDSTQRARPREFEQAAELLGKLPEPRLVVPGNHDLPLVSPLRVTAPYDRYRAFIGEDDPVVRIPGLTALGLNSMPWWRWKSGRVSPDQVAAVRRVLGGAPDGDVRLLALHHPVLSAGLERLAGRTRLTAALRAARADLVLTGHTHVPELREEGKLLLVTAGTATSHRVRGFARSWTLLKIHPDAIEVHERFESSPGEWFTGRVVRHPR